MTNWLDNTKILGIVLHEGDLIQFPKNNEYIRRVVNRQRHGDNAETETLPAEEKAVQLEFSFWQNTALVGDDTALREFDVWLKDNFPISTRTADFRRRHVMIDVSPRAVQFYINHIKKKAKSLNITAHLIRVWKDGHSQEIFPSS